MQKVRFEAVSSRNLQRHKSFTFWIVEKYHMSVEEAYKIASKFIKQRRNTNAKNISIHGIQRYGNHRSAS